MESVPQFSALAILAAAISVSDMRTMRIPDVLTAVFALLGAALCLAAGPEVLLGRVITASAVFLVLFLLDLAFRKCAGRTGLGFGDVKLLAACSLWLAPHAMPWLILLASLGGLGWIALCHAVQRGWNAGRQLPFAPFIMASLLVLVSNAGAAS